MNEPNLFEYRDYKKYLADRIAASPNRGWGGRARLAQALGCQTAYVSQVLRGHAQLSLEQADAASRFLAHAEDEHHYFLLLVQLARAARPSLRQYFEKQVRKVLENRLVLRHRVEVKSGLSAEDQNTYYSAWHYGAIHVAISIPSLQTKAALSAHFGLSLRKVTEILDFLVEADLATFSRGRYQVGTRRIHLGGDSPLIAKHHTNWRMRAIWALDNMAEDDLHYSSVVTLSEADAQKIKGALIGQITQAKEVIRQSKDEGVHGFSLDFFRL